MDITDPGSTLAKVLGVIMVGTVLVLQIRRWRDLNRKKPK